MNTSNRDRIQLQDIVSRNIQVEEREKKIQTEKYTIEKKYFPGLFPP